VAEDDASLAAASGVAPVGTELYFTREGRRPVLLKKEIIVTGSQIVDAQPTVDENSQPAVSVTLDGAAPRRCSSSRRTASASRWRCCSANAR
jgi:preprotein translocase subunit SecD